MSDGSRGTFERTLKVKRLAALTVPENLKKKSRYWSIFLPNITWKKDLFVANALNLLFPGI